ncbi:MAG: hypothetical protein JNJ86_15575 [Chitinophagaceae bacterium]|nr:hypothetical protein [Chitinophagaceae bacterium]
MKVKNCSTDIQPETIRGYFNASGITLTIEQARILLSHMYLLAEIALDIAENELASSTFLPETKV